MMVMVIIMMVVVCDNEYLYTNKYTCLMTKEMGMWNLLPRSLNTKGMMMNLVVMTVKMMTLMVLMVCDNK